MCNDYCRQSSDSPRTLRTRGRTFSSPPASTHSSSASLLSVILMELSSCSACWKTWLSCSWMGREWMERCSLPSFNAFIWRKRRKKEKESYIACTHCVILNITRVFYMDCVTFGQNQQTDGCIFKVVEECLKKMSQSWNYLNSRGSKIEE